MATVVEQYAEVELTSAAPGELAARLDAEIARRQAELLQSHCGGAHPLSMGERRGLERRLRYLRQLAAALPQVAVAELPAEGAGFGSVLLVREEESGRERIYKLVRGPVDRLDAAQVSLGSGLGRALLGCAPGDEVVLGPEGGRRRLRILTVQTLPQLVG